MDLTPTEQLAELNFDAITVDDAEMLYWQDKRLILNDGHCYGVEEERYF